MENLSKDKNEQVILEAKEESIALLFVIGQTFSKEEKKNVLERIKSSLFHINDKLLHVKDELVNAIQSHSFDSISCDQEYHILYRNDANFEFELLINSTKLSLKKALKTLFFSTSKNKILITSTIDLNSSGDLNLQDSNFTYDDFAALLSEEEIKKIINSKDLNESQFLLFFNSKQFDFNKNWKILEKSYKNFRLINQSNLTESKETEKFEISEFFNCLEKFLNEKTVDQLIEASKFTGTLRIIRPILYIFPAREGDSAFFTINGYSMLINGGYDRVRPCFWKLVSMLQQIDSVLITHSESDALGGLSSFFIKKSIESDIKPMVLTVLGNLIGTPLIKTNEQANGSVQKNSSAMIAANLIANEISSHDCSVFSQSYVDMILESIEKLKIKLIPLVKSDSLNKSNFSSHGSNSKYEQIRLYYKLGQGSLDLYVLNPFSNSNDYKEFLQQQHNNIIKHSHQKSHLNLNNVFRNIPLSHLTSAVVLLVWLPAVNKSSSINNENNALRLLFTGNAPQNVILSALEKVKDLEILHTPIYRNKISEPILSNVQNFISTKKNQSNSNIMVANNQSNVNQNGIKNSSSNQNANKSSLFNANSNAPSTILTSVNGVYEQSSDLSNPIKNVSRTSNIYSSNKEAVQSNKLQSNSNDKNSASQAKPSKLTSTSSSNSAVVLVSNGISNNNTSKEIQSNTNNPSIKKNLSNSNTNSISKKKIINSLSKDDQTEKEEKKNAEKLNIDKKPPTASSTKSQKPIDQKSSVSSKAAHIESNPGIIAQSANTVNQSRTSMSNTSKVDQSKLVKQPTKQLLSKPISVNSISKDSSNKKTSSSKPSTNNDQLKKDEASTESKIITKRDPKTSKPLKLELVKNDVGNALTDNTLPINKNNDDEPNLSLVNNDVVKSEMTSIAFKKEQETLNLEKKTEFLEQDSQPNFENTVEITENLTEKASEFSKLDSNENFEKTNETNIENLTEKVPEFSDIDSHQNFEKQNELIAVSTDCNFNDENSDLVSSVQTNQISDYNQWPNLSPVKKDQNRLNSYTNGEYLEENRNTSIDQTNESGLSHADESEVKLELDFPKQISENSLNIDSKEFIITAQEEEKILNEKSDIMTKSFIDDGSDNQANPFKTSVIAGEFKRSNDDSENDLNKTHELTDEEINESNKIDEDDKFVKHKFQEIQPENDTEKVIAGLQSLKIDSSNNENLPFNLNGNGHIEESTVISEDPSKWNILELPKPVNPNDVSTEINNTLPLSDKKLTPNAKKNSHLNSLSPSHESAANLKVASKHQNTSQSKSNKSSIPVNPVYVEVSYIPAHGSNFYADVEFFKKIRARNYILSSEEPNEQILNSLIEAKESWEEKNLQVSIIPTYESNIIRNWFTANEDNLTRLKIDVLPAANFSTLTLDENPELSCQCYKLEF